jgi:hypothetical protein
MDEILFPGAGDALHEAIQRHQHVFPYLYEAIDLAHLAYRRARAESAQYVPGIPKSRRVRNDINDDAWRYARSICEPLVTARLITSFESVDGGDLVVLPDGLQMRLKKGDPRGNTSNYPTPAIRQRGHCAIGLLFSGATALDVAIQEGVVVDVVYVAAEAHGEYEQVGLRYAAAEVSPFITFEPPSLEALQRISPAAHEIVIDARAKLAS